MPVHTVRFLLKCIATTGLYRIQRKCSHCVTATSSPPPIQPIISNNKSPSKVTQCERVLTVNAQNLIKDTFVK